MKSEPSHLWDSETILVAQLAALVSFFSFLYYLRQGDLLLYGDAVAHINIARRVFDSRTPGLLQLGTVWLPLPHLLMIPFLISNWMWQTGIGGSIPSLVAYVFSVAGIFRLVRGALSAGNTNENVARIAAWGAAIIFAANPNLIYLQTTAMTEPVYLAFFIWAVVYFSEFVQGMHPTDGIRGARSSLLKCALCLAAACLTRYDGWFLTAVIGACALLVIWRCANGRSLRRSFINFVLIAAAAPTLWLAYNAVVYRNPLEFANGPYSAKAIEERTSPPGSPPHPGSNNLPMAVSYFLKAGQLNVAPGNWGRFWLALAVAASIFMLWENRRRWPLLLLWVPVPFYMLSIAYSGVPIFLPIWWPHSLYNARYGIQLLPAFAVFVALAGYFAARMLTNEKYKLVVAAAILVLTVSSYASIWGSRSVSFREAWVNSRTRIALEKQLGAILKRLPANSTFLMYLGDHVGAFEYEGIPLRRVIYDGNHRTWVQPSDPEGLWERALADPSKYADYVIALDNDPVAQKVNHSELSTLLVLHVTGQPEAIVYSTHPAK
jgi:Dolichyl-phosphate-mannose-protein mannosyltransferase